MRPVIIACWFICGLFFSLVIKAQNLPLLPKGIEPLTSTSSDLKKVAEFKEEDKLSAEFQFEGWRIRAVIADEPCVWHGWNVKSGTIISLMFYPKTMIRLDTSDLIKQGFELVVDDTLREYYTNTKTGVQYYFDHDLSPKKPLVYVGHNPTSSSSKLRCSGFPPFNPTSYTYPIYDSFNLENFDSWDNGLLGDFGLRIKDAKSMKGTVFVYFKKQNFKDAQKFQKKLTEYFESVLRVDRERLKVRLGGRRDENRIETFLLLIEQGDPSPLPKYSSPEVFASELTTSVDLRM